jgi:hypothetical protein
LKAAKPTTSVGSDIADVNCSAVDHGLAEWRVWPDGVAITDALGLVHPPILRDQSVLITVDQIDQRVAGFAEPRGCSRDSVEHGLDISRRI